MSGANLKNPSRFASYAPNGVNFDGANDYLTRGANLTGNADSKKGIARTTRWPRWSGSWVTARRGGVCA